MVIIAVIVGGMLGAIARYSMAILFPVESMHSFPWTTLMVNLSGALLIGLLSCVFHKWNRHPLWLRNGLITGLIGAYTTFSTWSWEMLQLMQANAWGAALGYAASSIFGGLAAIVIGWQTVNRLWRDSKHKEATSS